MTTETFRFRPSIRLLALAALLAILGPAAAVAVDSIALDTTWRGGPLWDGADRYYLDVPGAGILTLDVSAPTDAGNRPTVEIQGDFELLYQSPASLVIDLPAAGAVWVAVAPEDPEHPLERYKLRNAFIPVSGTLCGRDKEVAERREEDDLRHESPSLPLPGTLCGRDKEVAERREEDDLHYDPPLVPCFLDGADDHGDTPLCATPLDPGGGAASGALDNPFGDDEDYFTFVLAGQKTVEIAAAGEVAGVLGALYDQRGQRLMAGEPEHGHELRLVRTLSAGRYFVRLESPHLRTGSYTLSVTPLKSF